MINEKNIILDHSVNLKPILNKKIAVIGYGNQGRSQAKNLKDSGFNVIVGLRNKSSSISLVAEDGLNVLSIDEAVCWADVVCILVSDKSMAFVYSEYIKPNLRANQTILFSHGYNIHYKLIIPPSNIDVIMVAPSAGGRIVREEYKKGKGIPTLLAVDQNFSGNALEIAKSYSKAIGGTKICAFISTFEEETETDIFGEQSILTGGLPYLINSSYNTLIENGYDSTVAWFVCYYEIKTIVDLFHNNGFKEFYNMISDTARYGGITRGNRLFDNSFKNELNNILEEIKSGSFRKEFERKNNNVIFPKSFDKLEKQTKKILEILNKK